MRAWMVGGLLFLVLPAGAAEPLLVAVAPDLPGPGPGDEGVAIWSPDPVDLSGWSLGDGEGGWRFPDGARLAAGEVAYLVGDEAVWAAHDGPAPRWSWADTSDAPVLANRGDQVHLVDPAGRVVDGFAWGDATTDAMDGAITTRSPGLVYQRFQERPDAAPGGGPEAAWVDRDMAADWITPRLHRIGESDLPLDTFHVDRVAPYAAPDHIYATLVQHIGAAKERLHIHLYELRSPALVDAVVAAKEAHPGLDLQVLVDEGPVGLTDSDRHEVAYGLQRVQDAGGDVFLAGKGRYAFHHLKVFVADDAVAVQSENGVPAGVPAYPSWGNRGWGAVVHDAALADWFSGWMAADRAAWDTQPFRLGAWDPLYQEPPRHHARAGAHDPVPALPSLRGDLRVTPIIAPEHTAHPGRMPVWDAIDQAEERVWVQQMTLRGWSSNRLGWDRPDPLWQALQDAAGRGVDVRVQAAAPFSPDDTRNEAVLAELAAAGVQVATLERPGITALHNKGIIVDDAVLVGSLNGNHASRARNREVALWMEGGGVADPYASWFLDDWRFDGRDRDWDAVKGDMGRLVEAVRDRAAPVPILLVGLLLAATYLGRDRR